MHQRQPNIVKSQCNTWLTAWICRVCLSTHILAHLCSIKLLCIWSETAETYQQLFCIYPSMSNFSNDICTLHIYLSTEVNMNINLRLNIGNLIHCSNHNSCSSHVSLYWIQDYRLQALWESTAEGGGRGSVGTEGGTAVYSLAEVGLYVCACVTQITSRATYFSLMHTPCWLELHLCLAHCIYLGEEVEAAQAADDAVYLREPSALTAGLQEKDSFKTLVCHKTAHPSTMTGLAHWNRARPLFRRDFDGTVRKKINKCINRIQEIFAG